jgi:tetraacyldisaccharide 4'-kinase
MRAAIRFQKILAPFSVIYWLATWARNKMFDTGLSKQHTYSIPVICVGNITVGGTGKTPHCEYLLEVLLRKGQRPALLSRGYKRLTTGYILYNQWLSASDVGDEPYQIANKLPQVRVAVCESRAEGINKLLQEPEPPSCVVLDDAFQHRYVKPSLAVILTDYSRPIYADMVFPAGFMREGFYARHRAQAVVVSKCPENLGHPEAIKIASSLKLKKGTRVFFSTIEYSKPMSAAGQPLLPGGKAVLLTGIARPEPFIQYCEAKYSISHVFTYPDHHSFTQAQFDAAAGKAISSGACLLTTEKDFTRIRPLLGRVYGKGFCLSVIPIKSKFLFSQQAAYDDFIAEHIQNFSN